MKTSYEEIVNVNFIGKQENPIIMNEILAKAESEGISPTSEAREKVLLIGIDPQQDFMDDGALGVPGAHGDIGRLTRFIYNNIEKISHMAVSIDTHIPHQIFHPCWWVDKDGKNVKPFTLITLDDIHNGIYTPVIAPIDSLNYVENLEKLGKKKLCIWPYHCLQGTPGCALENQFSNMINFFSVAKSSVIKYIVKGQDPYSEMYGIIKPEYSKNNYINTEFLNKLENYDKIIIAGEAASHCVPSSLEQMLEYYWDKPEITSKVYVLEDCMSPIPSYEAATTQAFNEFKSKYKINLVKSTDSFL